MQNKSEVSKVSFAALFCAFVVASGMISAPFYPQSLMPLVFACGLGIISAFVFFKISELILRVKSKTLNGVFYALIIAFSLFFAYLSAREFTGLIYESVLVQENSFLIKLIFALCVFYLAVSNIQAIYKFSLLSAAFVSVIFIVLFLTSAKTFDLKNLNGIFDFEADTFKQTSQYYLKLFLSVFGACVFAADSERNGEKSVFATVGTAFGILLCVIIISDTVLSFGLPFASGLPFPYVDDISTVSVGSLFTRMDGFAYFAFFVCYVLKCAVLTRLSLNLVLKTGIKKRKTATLLLTVPLLF